MNRVFLLSPANCNGVRAGWILRPEARSELARRLRTPEGYLSPKSSVFLARFIFAASLPMRGPLLTRRSHLREFY